MLFWILVFFLPYRSNKIPLQLIFAVNFMNFQNSIKITSDSGTIKNGEFIDNHFFPVHTFSKFHP